MKLLLGSSKQETLLSLLPVAGIPLLCAVSVFHESTQLVVAVMLIALMGIPHGAMDLPISHSLSSGNRLFSFLSGFLPMSLSRLPASPCG
ncbi:hypothetical protein [Veronia nyctiphanis]|uniref:hypothetical protein n=1 Tax=Veronia nyctiphanis TaxID=1278244 RepID=UPI001F429ABD|nr:hypothetical protein [Veronia nyctiphanis]